MSKKHHTGITVDRDLYEWMQLRAGSKGHSFSGHLNFIMAALEKMGAKDYDALLGVGMKTCLARKKLHNSCV